MAHHGLVLRRRRNGVVEHSGVAPDTTRITPRKVEEGKRGGWVATEGDRAVVRPAGPPHDPWRRHHTFVHCDAMTIAGVRYRVTHQPDKYADPGDDTTPVTHEMYAAGETRVDHFYGLERSDG